LSQRKTNTYLQMETHERLKLMISRLGITQSEFADKMGIQRSSISHLLSGRNKPGFSFFEKLLETFPEINIEWFVSEKGDMLKTKLKDHDELDFDLPGDSLENQDIDADETPVADIELSGQNNVDKPLKKNDEKKPEIEKILIIYDNKTFEEILPNQV